MILVAVAIMGILAGALAPVVSGKLDDSRMRSEAESLGVLRRDFEATFDSTDYSSINESSLSGAGLAPGTTATTFDAANAIGSRIYAPLVTVDPASWLSRIALKRGITSAVAQASYGPNSGGQYAALAFNAMGVQRCVVAGPTDESGMQRYLMLSLMVPAYRTLAFPGGDAVQTFNAIWDQSWDSVGAQAPATWSSTLTPDQIALWNEASVNHRSNASRLLLERIVQPKYSLTVANNSPTDTAWVDIGPSQNAMTCAPNSGTTLSSSLPAFPTGILSGRLIVVRRGASPTSAYEVQRFLIHSDVTITLQ